MASSRYYFYTVVNETLSELCKAVSCSTQEIIKINNQKYKDNKTVGQLMSESQVTGTKLPMGLSVKIPYHITGGREIDYTKYEVVKIEEELPLEDTDYNTNDVDKITYKDNYQVKGVVQEKDRFNFTLEPPPDYKMLPSVPNSWEKFNCFVTIYANRVPVSDATNLMLPVYPQEFTDNNEAHFGETPIFGRSVSYQTYNSSGRSVSLTLQLHEELCTDKTYIHKLVRKIESACYPRYDSGGNVQVPEISITIGKQFKCRGIITNCSAVWKAPIIEGKMVNCDLSLGIKETTGPYSMSDIISSGGYRNV